MLPSPNLRDIGQAVNRLATHVILREGVLFRSGELVFVRSLDQIGGPRTILNLETTEDPEWHEGEMRIHRPIPDTAEVYEVNSRETAVWLDSVLALAAAASAPLPLLIHCTAGKDRTGVVVAAMLAAMAIPRETILAEYELSTGPLHSEKIEALIDAVSSGRLVSRDTREALRARYTMSAQAAAEITDSVGED